MKIKKQKYIGACDTYELFWPRPILTGKPVYIIGDMSKNSANHLKCQGDYIEDRWVDDSNERSSFKYGDKL